MTNENIMDILKKIFINEFEIESDFLEPTTNIYSELDLDSLDSVDLIVALENEFKFKVNREKDELILREIRTVSDIIKYIKLKEKKDKE